MDGDVGLELGLTKLLITARSVPSWEYAILLLIIGLVWLYNAFEFHFVGDALNAWRGDILDLTYSPRSSVAAQLLSKCEILTKRYCPTPWLASPHLQTLFLHLFGWSPRIDYQRQLFITQDGGTIALDWVHPTSVAVTDHGVPGDMRQGSACDETPTVIIVPGLTSDSSNHYVKHLVHSLSGKGWRVLVINHRGLGGVSITSDYFYNAGWTEDLRTLLPYVQQKYPKSPLLAVGTSIGANILIKYLGEEGTKAPVGGAVAICCPWDLVVLVKEVDTSSLQQDISCWTLSICRSVCDRFIQRKWVQALYNKSLATGLCQYAQLHQTALSRMMDWTLLRSSKTVRDFDNHCTRHVGKYETVDTYYRKCGSAQFLENVAVPLLCISAEDDPICTKEAIPYDDCRVNPNVLLAVTKHGGHLGYFEGFTAKSIWYVRAATDFSKVLLSSSLLHQQNKGIDPASTSMGSDIDQGPFLAVGDNSTVASSAEDSSPVLEKPVETSDLGPETSLKEIDRLTGPQMIRDKSGSLASDHLEEDGKYVMVADDFGGPLYKNFETRDASINNESKVEKQINGQTTVKLQIRSFSELMSLQSVLSQLLQQLRQQSSTLQESRQDASPENVELHNQSKPFVNPTPISPSVTPGCGDCTMDNKEKFPVKSVQKYMKRPSQRGQSGQANPAKKDLASHLASQNRRTFWLLTYIALITTIPFLGSALMVTQKREQPHNHRQEKKTGINRGPL